MTLHGLLDAVIQEPALGEAVAAARNGNRPHLDLVGPPAARPLAVAALARSARRTVLAVTATGREAEDLAAALRSLLPADAVVEFPSWETSFIVYESTWITHEHKSNWVNPVTSNPLNLLK